MSFFFPLVGFTIVIIKKQKYFSILIKVNFIVEEKIGEKLLFCEASSWCLKISIKDEPL